MGAGPGAGPGAVVGMLEAGAAAPRIALPPVVAVACVAVIHAVLVSDRPDTHKAPRSCLGLSNKRLRRDTWLWTCSTGHAHYNPAGGVRMKMETKMKQ